MTIREVVDGQQRIRAILDFIEDKYRLSKTLRASWGGKKFSQLSPDEQERIMSFSISAEIFKGISDQQVLEVFCRVNMNGIPLNKQELRNGKYFGVFKQSSYDLSLSYLEFWRHHKIFTEQNIARMLEVELTSELLIAGNSGMQDKKNTIDHYYEEFEELYPNEERNEKNFREVMAVISDTFNGELSESEFSRPPLFYTLYCVVYHHIFGLPEVQRSSPNKRLTSDQKESLREAVVKLSEIITQSKDAAFDMPKRYVDFIGACLRQTDNLGPRKIRFNRLFDEAF